VRSASKWSSRLLRKKTRLHRGVVGGDRARHPPAFPPNSNALISRLCPPSILLVSLFVGVVSASGGGLAGGPTRHHRGRSGSGHRAPIRRAPVHRAPVHEDSERRRRRCGIRGVPAVAHSLHSTSYSPSWVRVHDSTSPASTAHVSPSVFTSTAEAKSVPLKIKCILQGMQGSKL